MFERSILKMLYELTQMMTLTTGALGVEWWLTAMSIAKRNIGKSTRMIAGQSSVMMVLGSQDK